MAEAARQYSNEPLVWAVPELADDSAVRAKAAGFIGAVATGAWQHATSVAETAEALATKPLESLMDAVHAAAAGDPTARKMVETNAFTDVIERTIKAGHVMKVDLMVDETGVVQQHGQTMESVQANSLRFASDNPQMRSRVEAETRNTFRIQHYYQQGTLQDYNFVVWSRAADDMSLSAMADTGFFTDTMSCAIQVTSMRGGNLVTESAFVAGTERPGMARHDEAAISAVGNRLGVDLEGKTATELLDTPLLIHKSLMPDGVLNLVELYDAGAGGTFFGEAKPWQDYREYRETCREREQLFKPKVDQIVRELVAEAATITSRPMAVERLHKISAKHMIELAVENMTIHPEVFGAPAAARIEVARWHIEAGDRQAALLEIEEAVKVDQSSSCPSGSGNSRSTNSAETTLGSSEESGDCTFISKKCPKCGAKNVKTTVKKLGTKKHISGECGCTKTV